MQGRSQDFSKGGGHTVSKQGLFNYGQDIVMAFSPPVVGCLVKRGLQKGGGGSRAAQDPPCLGIWDGSVLVLIKDAHDRGYHETIHDEHLR